jgi:hypothetical protein
MIRRDYILRMIAEFVQLLARINSLKGGKQWKEASGAVDEGFERLLGSGAATLAKLSHTELLALLIKGEPTQAVGQKALMVAALFKEAGELAAVQGSTEEGRMYHLKGLHLLLDPVAMDETEERPEFVPQVAAFVAALQEKPLPPEALVRLMHYYERTGDLAKAEDCLFELLDSGSTSPELGKFGEAFYGRLGHLTDSQLAAGNLPRAELDAGLIEFRQRVVCSK